MSALMSRELVGPPREVGAKVDALKAAGLLVTIGALEEHDQGMKVLVVVRKPAGMVSDARQLPAGTRPAWSPRAWTALQRRAARVAGLSATVGGGLVFLVWLVGRAVAGAKTWAAANPVVVIGLAVAAGLCGLLWLTRNKRGSGGGSSCPGMVHHCAKCPDHR